MAREWLGILMISTCIGAEVCAAAEPMMGKSPVTSAEDLDEVLVRSSRLSHLKAAIAEAEDRFYVRYNDLNKVDDFDIECAVDAPLGTKIPQRVCLTKVQLNAKAQYGLEYLLSLQAMAKFAGGTQGLGKPPDINPTAVWDARYDEYKKNMLSLLEHHPDLRRLAREGEEAKERYDAEYKRRLKGRLMSGE